MASSDSDSDMDFTLAELTEMEQPLATLLHRHDDEDSDISVEDDSGSDYVPSEEEKSDSDIDQPGPSVRSDSKGRGASKVGPSGDSGCINTRQWSGQFFATPARVCSVVSGPPRPWQNFEDPYTSFSAMWSSDLYQLMAVQTNLFARQKLMQSGVAEDRLDKVFPPTTVDEIRAYIGLLVFMSISKLPRKELYWARSKPTYNPWVDTIMSLNRFRAISRFFHLADSTQAVGRDQEGYDPLYKVRPLISATQESFQSGFYPGQNLTVDEAMVKFKGRCSFRQYLPSKPTKYGLKVWALCDADTYYMCRFCVYTGKRNDLPITAAGVPQGEAVVHHLVEPYLHLWHTVYMDNWFTSVALYEYLFARQTLACGTVRQDRRGTPPELKERCVRSSGDCKQWFSSLGDRDDQGCLQCVAWFDNRKVCFLSTAHDQSQGTVVRKASKGKPERTYARPTVAKDYNLNYNGVDKHDQLRSAFGSKLKFKKWWKYLFFFCLDSALVNAYCIHKFCAGKPLNHLEFQFAVMHGMIGGFKGRKRRLLGSPSAANPPAPLASHTPTKIMSARGVRNCVLCSRRGNKTAAGNAIQTSFECRLCGVALCQTRGCFRNYHEH